MRCDHCHEREAVVHLTQVAGDQTTQVHLCEKCAAEKGIEPATALVKSPLGGFLAQLSPSGGVEGAEAELRCPRCGAGLSDFRDVGRLGCPECWSTFAGPLTELVRRLHGATRHTGERYHAPGAPVPAGPSPETERLREELREAVASEDFERAARLRDALKARS
ncbi:MAG TPA: UvrB/UvrC motif-containing protein [Gemmatimonadales bacterium]|nr:UvrB/UvrC motif-containing protein [Gemmatimonadales bacterium]